MAAKIFHVIISDLALFIYSKQLLDCLQDIKAWVAIHFFNFNESKVEDLLGPNGACDVPQMDLRSLEPHVKPSVKDLGVVIDSQFELDKHSVIKSLPR